MLGPSSGVDASGVAAVGGVAVVVAGEGVMSAEGIVHCGGAEDPNHSTLQGSNSR